MSGTLFVVATPIGNLSDISMRAIDVLQKADLILVEDTRNSRRLCQQFDIKAPLRALHEHNESDQVAQVLLMLQQGKQLALISDAGTPLIADPGYSLVRAARAEHLTVVPVPGSSAMIAALSASGLPTDRFAFGGFVPSKSQQRQQFYQRWLEEFTGTLVFYETPHRIVQSLQDLVAMDLKREMVVARELTKVYEEFIGYSASEVLSYFEQNPDKVRGEMVLMLGPEIQQKERLLSRSQQEAARLIAKELPPNKASKLIAQLYGLSKRDVYAFLQQDDAK